MSERHTKSRKPTQRKALHRPQEIVQTPAPESQQQWNTGLSGTHPSEGQFTDSHLYNAQSFSVPFQPQANIHSECGNGSLANTWSSWSPEQNNNPPPVSGEQIWNAQPPQESWNWQSADMNSQPQQVWGDYLYQQQAVDPSAWCQQPQNDYYDGHYSHEWQQNFQVTGAQTNWQSDVALANFESGQTNQGGYSNVQLNLQPENNGNTADFAQVTADLENQENTVNENFVVNSQDNSAFPLDINVKQEPRDSALSDTVQEDSKHAEKVDEPNQEVLEPVQKVEIIDSVPITEITNTNSMPELSNCLQNLQSKEPPESPPRSSPDQQNQESPVNGQSIGETRKVVIQPREGSLFQPPVSHHSRVVVQQELPVESPQTVAKTLQEPECANLETEPDNLEKPPDVDVPRRQHLGLHRHLATANPSLDCTTLWENPDIPTVTFIPSLVPSTVENVSSPQRVTSLPLGDTSSQKVQDELRSQESNSVKTKEGDAAATVTEKEVSPVQVRTLNSLLGSPTSQSKNAENEHKSHLADREDRCNTSPNKEGRYNSQTNRECRYNNQSDRADKYNTQSGKEDRYSSQTNREDRYNTRVEREDRYNTPADREDRYNTQTDREDRYNTRAEREDRYNTRAEREDRYNTPADREDRYNTPADREDRYNTQTDREDRYHTRAEREDRYSSPADREDRYNTRAEREDRYNTPVDREDRYNTQTDREDRYNTRAEREDRYNTPADREDRSNTPSAIRHTRDDNDNRQDFARRTDSPRYHGGRHRYYDDDHRHADSRYYSGSRPSSRSSEPYGGTSTDRHYYREGEDRRSEQYYDRYHRRGEDYSERKNYDDRLSREQEYYDRERRVWEYAKGYDYGSYYPEYPSYHQNYNRYYGRYPRNYDYGYIDEFYRSDPRYREQLEQYYKTYYGAYGEVDSDRLSIHSSRSSVTNEFNRDNLQEKGSKEFDTSSDYSGYNHDSNASFRNEEPYSFNYESGKGTEAARLTPHQFSGPHCVARFSAGRLITVATCSSDTALTNTVEIHDLQTILNSANEVKEVDSFPGPLVRGQTHKNDVIHYCNERIKEVQLAKNAHDRESQILLWELLVLLLRQNGCLVGSDIAELLLKGHEALQPPRIAKSFSDSLNVGGSDVEYSVDGSSPDEGIVVTQDKSLIGSSAPIPIELVTQKFREYLFFGHKKDALEWAIKNGLWGHALFLASKMDPRTYGNVMTRFANSLTLSDPLQTLYQLMSGRQPSAVTSVLDDKWGDWKPHLAMILSNPSAHPEVDQRSITSLGDTLAQKGSLWGSHFCYLMTQVDFGSFDLKSSKMVLLGSSHLQPFQEFSNCTAVHCTEIYEYAQSLANPYFVLPHLQLYKFLYATQLAERGFLQEAVHYCEILSGLAVQMPSYFTYTLLSQIYELGNKLKYHDPCFASGQGELEEQIDPIWLQNLCQLLQTDTQCQAPSFEALQPPATEATSTVSTFDSVQQNYQTDMYNPETFLAGNVPSQSQDLSLTYATPVTTPFEDNFPVAVEASALPASPASSNANSTLDYYGLSTQKTFTRDRQDSINSLGRRSSSASTTGPPSVAAPSSVPKTQVREEAKEAVKDIRPQTGKSWLGGLFGKLLPRGENQMILPDDTDKAIIWDPTQNEWINTAEDSSSNVIPPQAPPTDLQIKSMNENNAAPGVNQFQRPKNKGMKHNYVDILKSSGNSKPAPTYLDQNLSFPEQTSPLQNHFVPTPVPVEEVPTTEFAPMTPPPVQELGDPLRTAVQAGDPVPKMFDPEEFKTSYNVTTGNTKSSRLGRRSYLR